MKKRLVFCGTPEFAVPSLEALASSSAFEVVLVLSQPDRPSGRGQKLQMSPVKKRALELGLPVITPEKATAPEILEQLAQCQAELGVVVAYGQILSQKFLDLFPKGCVNVHSSLLPRWRGAAPMQRALMAGDRESGVSLQKVVRRLDAGPVLGEHRLSLPEDLGATELTARLSQLGAELLLQLLPRYFAGTIELHEQDESQVTHAAKIDKAEGLIDWQKDSRTLHNLIRGLDMGGPYATTQFRGRGLKIHKSRIVQEEKASSLPSSPGNSGEVENLAPGCLVEVGQDFLRVQCGRGCLDLLQVQPESKARMSVTDFIRGYQPLKGEHFV